MHFKQLLSSAFRICLSAVMIALLLSQISFCQITFFMTYGDTARDHNDKGYAVLQTEDGGYIAAGEYGRYIKTYNRPLYQTYFYGDVYLVKTDEYGNTLWTKTYGDTGAVWEGAYSMDMTPDGGYIISAFSLDSISTQLWLIKTDSNGDSVWTKKYPMGAGNCIRQTNDGGFVITGYGAKGKSNIYLLKIDLQGDTLWLKTYGDSGSRGYYVQQTSDSGYIVASSGLVIKTDSKGDTLWTKILYPGLPHSICETKDDGYLIAGEYTEQPCEGCELELHILLVRTDSKGDTLWTRKINNGSSGDYAYAMKKTSDGGFIIAGETMGIGTERGIYLLKLDEEENYQWFSVIGSNLDKTSIYSGYDVAETSNGGYLITGSKWFWAFDYQDLCLVKVNDKGQLTGVNELKTKIPSEFELLQNYPNPFNPSTTISYALPVKADVQFIIYDIMGREVKTLVSSKQEAGHKEIVWDGRNNFNEHVTSGIYVCRLKATSLENLNVFEKSIKLVLIK
jgi:hypothetical protein